MIEAGKVLQQRYQIDKQIGQGGMGAVYVATDQRFGSVVAIKETLCMDSNFRKAIEREARLLNSLKHAALPRVTDHFEENDSQYLVMEFIPGEDLGHILEDRKSSFAVSEVMKWADQLLDALDYLHGQDIPVIHRDIKPQNLKVTNAGQIILLDFGLAKGNPTDAGHNTNAKSIFGYSRNYASIEQIQGTGTDPRSDLYSLSATLYHLLTGVAPEDALTRAMAVLSQNPDPLVAASSVNPDVPRGVAGVLQRSLDLNAAGRPATASEMRQMLRESENYAYLADHNTEVSFGGSVASAIPVTNAMAENTRPILNPGVEAKTEMMPANLSQLTAVRPGGSHTDGQPQETVQNVRSGGAVPKVLAAGFAALLLVGAAIGGGVFLFRNGQVPANAKSDNTNSQTVGGTAETTEQKPSTAGGAANTVAPESTGSTLANTEKAKTATTTEKPADTAKTGKTPATGKPGTRDEVVDIQAPPDEDIPGDMVITRKNPDGSTTTTRILKNGVQPPDVGRPPMGPRGQFPPGFDPGKLSPTERKKLRIMLEKNGIRPGQPYPQRQQ